jgi:hypothetical protein
MRFSYASLLIAALSGTTSVFAFAPRKATVYNTKLFANAGAGIATVPEGDRKLFDPEVEGMMGGTTNLDRRLRDGINFKPIYFDVVAPPPPAGTLEAQAWLEDIGVPQNFAKPTAPVTATVLGRAKLISDDAPGDIQHLVVRLPQGFHYVEGQSISVIPPGVQENGKPNKPRLYSIASTRYGDLLDGNTVSLCVRRAEYYIMMIQKQIKSMIPNKAFAANSCATARLE